MVANNFKNIGVKEETKKLVFRCKQEFIRNHPELKEIPISDNKIIYEICKYYLEED